jgi:hypothetical protein
MHEIESESSSESVKMEKPIIRVPKYRIIKKRKIRLKKSLDSGNRDKNCVTPKIKENHDLCVFKKHRKEFDKIVKANTPPQKFTSTDIEIDGKVCPTHSKYVRYCDL